MTDAERSRPAPPSLDGLPPWGSPEPEAFPERDWAREEAARWLERARDPRGSGEFDRPGEFGPGSGNVFDNCGNLAGWDRAFANRTSANRSSWNWPPADPSWNQPSHPPGPHPYWPPSPMAGPAKDLVIAYVLLVFLGSLGVHKFYVRSPGIGILYLTLALFGWMLSISFVGLYVLLPLWGMLLSDLFSLPDQVRKANSPWRF